MVAPRLSSYARLHARPSYRARSRQLDREVAVGTAVMVRAVFPHIPACLLLRLAFAVIVR